MTGADEAQYLAATQAASRLVMFPDGLARHITLKHCHWQLFDWLRTEKRWTEEAFAEGVFQAATEFCKDPERFEEQIRRSFSMFMDLTARYHAEESRRIAVSNDG